MWLLSGLFKRLIRVGTLVVIDAAGKRHEFAGSPGPVVTLRLHDRKVATSMALNPALRVGEAYMDGRLSVVDGEIDDLLHLAAINIYDRPLGPLDAAARLWRQALKRWHQHNPMPRARRNVAHHYDLSGELYSLFLDTDRQYSCAYFTAKTDSLETAQENKKRHIAAKLLLRPGLSVLDIGSGWGGMGLYLAQAAEARVNGVTLSEEQHRVSNERARAAGLDHRVQFHLRDYREETARYDRVVSVGMFEHVGVVHYAEYFAKLRDLLVDDGVALLHTIGRSDGPGTTNPWIDKYIFPGGYSPALSEIVPAIERAGLFVTDIEVLRLHYAETLREWRRRFKANRDRVKQIYDERFCRMWEFYLAGSEIAFRDQGRQARRRRSAHARLHRTVGTAADRTRQSRGLTSFFRLSPLSFVIHRRVASP
jgi:cyclopropane-fatty-acyl-phospholipid synthase